MQRQGKEAQQGLWRKTGSFHTSFCKAGIPQESFLFPQKTVEICQDWEVMLVLMSLMVSAKTGSFFIFFSTCWME